MRLLLLLLILIPAQERKLRVVFFSAHPDDPMWGAAGLMATLSRDGHEVISAYATCFRGDRKIGEEPEGVVRRREAEASCRIVGARPKFFDYAHEKLVADAETAKAVADWLGEVKPDVVVTHWPMDTHPNHHAASSLVWQCYAPVGGWNLYGYELSAGGQTRGFVPDVYLDLSGLLELKRRGLDGHAASLRAISGREPAESWALTDAVHLKRGTECGLDRAEAYSLVEAKPGVPLLPVRFHKKRCKVP